jgi:hypothetical protein
VSIAVIKGEAAALHFPYRAGLAAHQFLTSSTDYRFTGRLLSPRPFGSRSAVDPRTLLSVLPGCTRDTIVRDAAHGRPS